MLLLAICVCFFFDSGCLFVRFECICIFLMAWRLCRPLILDIQINDTKNIKITISYIVHNGKDLARTFFSLSSSTGLCSLYHGHGHNQLTQKKSKWRNTCYSLYILRECWRCMAVSMVVSAMANRDGDEGDSVKYKVSSTSGHSDDKNTCVCLVDCLQANRTAS